MILAPEARETRLRTCHYPVLLTLFVMGVLAACPHRFLGDTWLRDAEGFIGHALILSTIVAIGWLLGGAEKRALMVTVSTMGLMALWVFYDHNDVGKTVLDFTVWPPMERLYWLGLGLLFLLNLAILGGIMRERGDQHTITDLVIHPNLLIAYTFDFLGTKVFSVYRSPIVRDDDPIYAPVMEHIRKHRFELHRQGIFVDVDMMFGQGELSLYLHPAKSRRTPPSDETLISLAQARA